MRDHALETAQGESEEFEEKWSITFGHLAARASRILGSAQARDSAAWPAHLAKPHRTEGRRTTAPGVIGQFTPAEPQLL